MCKFNNRLFVFTLISLITFPHGFMVLAKPVTGNYANKKDSSNMDFNELMALTALLAPQDNYDLHYDQRQKGEENYRLKLDGFVIGVPQEEESALLLFTDDLLENIDDDFLLGSSKNKQLLPTIPPRHVSSNTDQAYQNQAENKPLANGPIIVEIPAPNRQGEARQRLGNDLSDELKIRPESRTRSYISHLLNLLKRGRRN